MSKKVTQSKALRAKIYAAIFCLAVIGLGVALYLTGVKQDSRSDASGGTSTVCEQWTNGQCVRIVVWGTNSCENRGLYSPGRNCNRPRR